MKKKVQVKRAIVLCGGGSLGAYEMGVWRALKELDIHFDIVTGTSIGALNGAMMAMNDYEGALKLWNSISVDNVMQDGININADFFKTTFSLRKNSRFRKFLRQYFHHKGANIEPFEKLVASVMDPLKIKCSPIDLGIVTTSWPDLKEVDIRVKDLDVNEIIPYLHASSACYPIFPIKKIGKKKFVDGGFRNNLPIDLAVEMGANEIIAVELDAIPAAQFSELEDLPFVTKIVPTWNTGSMMDFRQEKIQRNMILGYNDALKAFKKKIGIRYTFNIPNEEQKKTIRELAKIFFVDLVKRNTRNFSEIDDILRFREKGQMSEEDYLIRALESFAEYAHIDYHQIYDIDDFLVLLERKIDGLKNNLHVMHAVSKVSEGKINKNTSNRALAFYIFNQIRNNKNIDEFATKYKKDARICIIISLLLSLKAYKEK